MTTTPTYLGGPPKAPRITPEEVAEFRRLHDEGWSYKAIAREYGRSDNGVARVLDESRRQRNADAIWVRYHVDRYGLEGIALYRKYHERAGLCRDCNDPVAPGRTSCSDHLTKAIRRMQASRSRTKE